MSDFSAKDNHMIPVNQPLLDGNEKRYLIECIDGSGYLTL